MTPSGLRVGVAFGGRSVEHDVSIITGLQALEVLGERHHPIPIYIARSGRWYTGDALRDLSTYQRGGGDAGGGDVRGGDARGGDASGGDASGGDASGGHARSGHARSGHASAGDALGGDALGGDALGGDALAADVDAEEIHFDLHRGRLLRERSGGSLLRRRNAPEPIELDVVVLATHGTQGEDGCLQGALELARLPYVGPPVGAAAAAMDKVATKAILAQAGLPALEHLALRREQWERDPQGATHRARQRIPFPLYVKPASLGSSVGVSRCSSEAGLSEALELVFELDRVCLIEPAVEDGIEVNCAVIGRPGADARASVCEQPIAAESFLSFEDKYMHGGKGGGMKGAQRLIPAPLEDSLTQRIQELAKRTFAAFGCGGVTRVDFLLDAERSVYVNECNTIPGSFSFYLWEPAGVPFVELMDELIELALADHREKLRTTTVFGTNLLAQRAAGAKTGAKV
jgi:D-alanine-D-alanine ligase